MSSRQGDDAALRKECGDEKGSSSSSKSGDKSSRRRSNVARDDNDRRKSVKIYRYIDREEDVKDRSLSQTAMPSTGQLSHLPDQFPGQIPQEYAIPYRPHLSTTGSHGEASSYYGDQGQSVAHQPGVRPGTPIVVGAEPHLLAASAVPNPAHDTGNGSAAAYFADSSHSSMHQDMSGGHANGAIKAASQYPATPPTYPPIPILERPGQASSRPQSQHGLSYAVPMAVGAAGLVAAEYVHHQHQSQHHNQHSYSTTTQSYPSSSAPYSQRPRPSRKSPPRRKGTLRRFAEWWNDYEDVRKMEEYTEYIGVCRDCFDPNSRPGNTPRKHRYHRRGYHDYQCRIDKDDRYSSSSSSASSSDSESSKRRRSARHRHSPRLERQTSNRRDTSSGVIQMDSHADADVVDTAGRRVIDGAERRMSYPKTHSRTRDERNHYRRQENRENGDVRHSDEPDKRPGLFASFFSPSSTSVHRIDRFQHDDIEVDTESRKMIKRKRADDRYKPSTSTAAEALVGLGATAAALIATGQHDTRRPTHDSRLPRQSYPSHDSSRSDQSWESASETDGSSSVDSKLAYGEYEVGRNSKRRSSSTMFTTATRTDSQHQQQDSDWQGERRERKDGRRGQSRKDSDMPSPNTDRTRPMQNLDPRPMSPSSAGDGAERRKEVPFYHPQPISPPKGFARFKAESAGRTLELQQDHRPQLHHIQSAPAEYGVPRQSMNNDLHYRVTDTRSLRAEIARPVETYSSYSSQVSKQDHSDEVGFNATAAGIAHGASTNDKKRKERKASVRFADLQSESEEHSTAQHHSRRSSQDSHTAFPVVDSHDAEFTGIGMVQSTSLFTSDADLAVSTPINQKPEYATRVRAPHRQDDPSARMSHEPDDYHNYDQAIVEDDLANPGILNKASNPSSAGTEARPKYFHIRTISADQHRSCDEPILDDDLQDRDYFKRRRRQENKEQSQAVRDMFADFEDRYTTEHASQSQADVFRPSELDSKITPLDHRVDAVISEDSETNDANARPRRASIVPKLRITPATPPPDAMQQKRQEDREHRRSPLRDSVAPDDGDDEVVEDEAETNAADQNPLAVQARMKHQSLDSPSHSEKYPTSYPQSPADYTTTEHMESTINTEADDSTNSKVQDDFGDNVERNTPGGFVDEQDDLPDDVVSSSPKVKDARAPSSGSFNNENEGEPQQEAIDDTKDEDWSSSKVDDQSRTEPTPPGSIPLPLSPVAELSSPNDGMSSAFTASADERRRRVENAPDDFAASSHRALQSVGEDDPSPLATSTKSLSLIKARDDPRRRSANLAFQHYSDAIPELIPLPISRPGSPYDKAPTSPVASSHIPVAPVTYGHTNSSTPSSTAIPLRFLRHAQSPSVSRSSPSTVNIASSPIRSPPLNDTPVRSKVPRPASGEFKVHHEFRPLYLVERNTKPMQYNEEESFESLPSLPSSTSASIVGSRAPSLRDVNDDSFVSAAQSPAGSLVDELEPAAEYFEQEGYFDMPEHYQRHDQVEYLNSQQTTPRASIVGIVEGEGGVPDLDLGEDVTVVHHERGGMETMEEDTVLSPQDDLPFVTPFESSHSFGTASPQGVETGAAEESKHRESSLIPSALAAAMASAVTAVSGLALMPRQKASEMPAAEKEAGDTTELGESENLPNLVTDDIDIEPRQSNDNVAVVNLSTNLNSPAVRDADSKEEVEPVDMDLAQSQAVLGEEPDQKVLPMSKKDKKKAKKQVQATQSMEMPVQSLKFEEAAEPSAAVVTQASSMTEVPTRSEAPGDTWTEIDRPLSKKDKKKAKKKANRAVDSAPMDTMLPEDIVDESGNEKSFNIAGGASPKSELALDADLGQQEPAEDLWLETVKPLSKKDKKKAKKLANRNLTAEESGAPPADLGAEVTPQPTTTATIDEENEPAEVAWADSLSKKDKKKAKKQARQADRNSASLPTLEPVPAIDKHHVLQNNDATGDIQPEHTPLPQANDDDIVEEAAPAEIPLPGAEVEELEEKPRPEDVALPDTSDDDLEVEVRPGTVPLPRSGDCDLEPELQTEEVPLPQSTHHGRKDLQPTEVPLPYSHDPDLEMELEPTQIPLPAASDDNLEEGLLPRKLPLPKSNDDDLEEVWLPREVPPPNSDDNDLEELLLPQEVALPDTNDNDLGEVVLSRETSLPKSKHDVLEEFLLPRQVPLPESSDEDLEEESLPREAYLPESVDDDLEEVLLAGEAPLPSSSDDDLEVLPLREVPLLKTDDGDLEVLQPREVPLPKPVDDAFVGSLPREVPLPKSDDRDLAELSPPPEVPLPSSNDDDLQEVLQPREVPSPETDDDDLGVLQPPDVPLPKSADDGLDELLPQKVPLPESDDHDLAELAQPREVPLPQSGDDDLEEQVRPHTVQSSGDKDDDLGHILEAENVPLPFLDDKDLLSSSNVTEPQSKDAQYTDLQVRPLPDAITDEHLEALLPREIPLPVADDEDVSPDVRPENIPLPHPNDNEEALLQLAVPTDIPLPRSDEDDLLIATKIYDFAQRTPIPELVALPESPDDKESRNLGEATASISEDIHSMPITASTDPAEVPITQASNDDWKYQVKTKKTKKGKKNRVNPQPEFVEEPVSPVPIDSLAGPEEAPRVVDDDVFRHEEVTGKISPAASEIMATADEWSGSLKTKSKKDKKNKNARTSVPVDDEVETAKVSTGTSDILEPLRSPAQTPAIDDADDSWNFTGKKGKKGKKNKRSSALGVAYESLDLLPQHVEEETSSTSREVAPGTIVDNATVEEWSTTTKKGKKGKKAKSRGRPLSWEPEPGLNTYNEDYMHDTQANDSSQAPEIEADDFVSPHKPDELQTLDTTTKENAFGIEESEPEHQAIADAPDDIDPALVPLPSSTSNDLRDDGHELGQRADDLEPALIPLPESGPDDSESPDHAIMEGSQETEPALPPSPSLRLAKDDGHYTVDLDEIAISEQAQKDTYDEAPDRDHTPSDNHDEQGNPTDNIIRKLVNFMTPRVLLASHDSQTLPEAPNAFEPSGGHELPDQTQQDDTDVSDNKTTADVQHMTRSAPHSRADESSFGAKHDGLAKPELAVSLDDKAASGEVSSLDEIDVSGAQAEIKESQAQADTPVKENNGSEQNNLQPDAVGTPSWDENYNHGWAHIADVIAAQSDDGGVQGVQAIHGDIENLDQAAGAEDKVTEFPAQQFDSTAIKHESRDEARKLSLPVETTEPDRSLVSQDVENKPVSISAGSKKKKKKARPAEREVYWWSAAEPVEKEVTEQDAETKVKNVPETTEDVPSQNEMADSSHQVVTATDDNTPLLGALPSLEQAKSVLNATIAKVEDWALPSASKKKKKGKKGKYQALDLSNTASETTPVHEEAVPRAAEIDLHTTPTLEALSRDGSYDFDAAQKAESVVPGQESGLQLSVDMQIPPTEIAEGTAKSATTSEMGEHLPKAVQASDDRVGEVIMLDATAQPGRDTIKDEFPEIVVSTKKSKMNTQDAASTTLDVKVTEPTASTSKFDDLIARTLEDGGFDPSLASQDEDYDHFSEPTAHDAFEGDEGETLRRASNTKRRRRSRDNSQDRSTPLKERAGADGAYDAESGKVREETSFNDIISSSLAAAGFGSVPLHTSDQRAGNEEANELDVRSSSPTNPSNMWQTVSRPESPRGLDGSEEYSTTIFKGKRISEKGFAATAEPSSDDKVESPFVDTQDERPIVSRYQTATSHVSAESEDSTSQARQTERAGVEEEADQESNDSASGTPWAYVNPRTATFQRDATASPRSAPLDTVFEEASHEGHAVDKGEQSLLVRDKNEGVLYPAAATARRIFSSPDTPREAIVASIRTSSTETPQPVPITKQRMTSLSTSELANTQRQYSRSAHSQLPSPGLREYYYSPTGSIVSNQSRSITPSLRRTDRKLSGDLRVLSQQGSDVGTTTGADVDSVQNKRETSDYDPLRGSGNSRMSETSQQHEEWRDTRTSPRAPPSLYRKQSKHILDLENKLAYLTAENETLSRSNDNLGDMSKMSSGQSRDLILQAKDTEISQIKAKLSVLQQEAGRLREHNDQLQTANRNLSNDANGRYGTLQAENAELNEQYQRTLSEFTALRQTHDRLNSNLEDTIANQIASALMEKDLEIRSLRTELDRTASQVTQLQRQLLTARHDEDYLEHRDEDYFDGACQELCKHVQQWILRFSKFSDNKPCRLTDDLNDERIEGRLDNAMLDGTDVDVYLADRVKRRDVFMSVVMTMIWEYIFTRYLFGLEREQRQKLKALERTLSEVGPARAVASWRATTLALLSRLRSFSHQREQDTEAVVQEILNILSALLPPPDHLVDQLADSLRRIIRLAVGLSIEMRIQKPEYIMLPPLHPEYDENGNVVRKVHFNASLMNERSGAKHEGTVQPISNEDYEARESTVRLVLFPLVVKKGDEAGEGEEEIVVCPAQVLVSKAVLDRPRKVVRLVSQRSMMEGRSNISAVSGGGSVDDEDVDMSEMALDR